MGTGGNVDPIVPGKTRTYRDGGEAVEGGGIPMCTLRNFPHLIDHCIEWSRDQFEAIFVKPVKRAGVFCEDPASFIGDLYDKADDPSAAAGACTDVANLIKTLKSAQGASIESCAQLALDYFYALFRDKLIDLITTYPKDARVIKDGVDKGPFWSEKKKFPSPATYDGENMSHVGFMLATTHLIAEMLGVWAPYGGDDPTWLADMRSKEWINGVVAGLTTPEYVPSVVVNEEDDGEKEEGKKEEGESPGETLGKLLKELEGFRGMTFQGKDADFEKDDDYNFHIEFITAASNMRAGNYSIPPTDFGKAKLVAGKIIPAIATTTAAVTGLVVLELFKMVQGLEIGSFRNRQIGLARNIFTSFEPDPPISKKSSVKKVAPAHEELGEEDFDEKGLVKEESYVKEIVFCYPDGHSCWDKILVEEDFTLGQFKTWMEEKHGLRMSGWGMQNDPFVYPPKASYGAEVLPDKEDGQGEAFKKIRADARVAAKDKMLVLSMWQKYKKSGETPVKAKSTLEMKLTELLREKAGVELAGRGMVELEGVNFVGMEGKMVDADTSAEGVDAEVPAIYLKLM
jgi:ubiquitin-activating enzyme E1